MSWKREHKVVSRQNRSLPPRKPNTDMPMGSNDMEVNVLPEVYAGHPERTNRYSQYDQMDMDSQINSALNTIADFSTQSDSDSKLFQVKWSDPPSDTEVEIIDEMLRYWTRINKFRNRLWRIFRNVIKYGDEVMIRDPETFEWYHVPAEDVQSVVINEARGKKAEYYLIQNLNINIETLTAATSNQFGSNTMSVGTASLQNPLQPGNFQTPGRQGTFGNGNLNVSAVSASNVVHLSLSEGLDAGWPFGTSILESVFKDYKQKQLLEDAILIYRIQRAPERRVFYVDVGNMPPHKAHAWVERMKNEIKQKRIPSRTGSGGLGTDSRYDPMCLHLDTRIPLLDGRTLPLSDLIAEYENGKENWVYSCDPKTGEVVPGPITWAGITRRNTDVIRLTFDNGESLTCTPDHKIPVQGKGFVEAKDLSVMDSLIPFQTRDSSTQVFDISTHQWREAVRIKDEFFGEYQGSRIEGDIVIRKLTSIESLREKIDTGTITVDGTETYHNHHTFAIEAGIFVKNSMIEDFWIPQTAEGRGSKVTTLSGGQGLGNIDDLNYFNNKLAAGLGVPQSYLPNPGSNETGASYNDGRPGAAYVQEFRFSEYCQRLQRLLEPTFDKEFKIFLKHKGFENIDPSSFDIELNTPQHFSDYSKMEKQATQINLFTQLAEMPFFSKRYLLMEYLGWSYSDIERNEQMWAEENPSGLEAEMPSESTHGNPNMPGLGDINMNPDMEDTSSPNEQATPEPEPQGEAPNENQ